MRSSIRVKNLFFEDRVLPLKSSETLLPVRLIVFLPFLEPTVSGGRGTVNEPLPSELCGFFLI